MTTCFGQGCEKCDTCKLEAANTEKSRRAFDLPDKPFPLEIAAGERPTPGFIHNDARPLEDIEIVCDAVTELSEIVGEGGASAVRACHVLEHFPYNETVNILSRWGSMLVSGGGLHIEVPNLSWQVNALATGEISDRDFVYFCFGEQNYPGNFHCAGFTEDILMDSLVEAGFSHISVTNIGQVLVATATKL